MSLKFKGKKFEKLKAKLKRENAAFRKLSKKDQRIAIAKDVIKLLKTDKIIARSSYLTLGNYDEFSDVFDSDLADIMVDTSDDDEHDTCAIINPKIAKLDASLLLEQMLPACEVCGIGSLFVAALRKNDKMTIEHFKDKVLDDATRDHEVEYLAKWFDSQQLDLIEEYFEDRSGCDSESPIYSVVEQDKRLVMIMENIVSNKGEFDPHRGKHAIPEPEASE